jgi:hypothetical protein
VPTVVRRFVELGRPAVVGWYDGTVTVWQRQVDGVVDAADA